MRGSSRRCCSKSNTIYSRAVTKLNFAENSHFISRSKKTGRASRQMSRRCVFLLARKAVENFSRPELIMCVVRCISLWLVCALSSSSAFSFSLDIKLLFAAAPRGDVDLFCLNVLCAARSAETPQLLRKFIFNGLISATRKVVFGRFTNFCSDANFASI